jgi:hypothetical protein
MGGLSNRWFCVGSDRRGGDSSAFFLSSFGVVVAELLVFGLRGVFRLLILLRLCRSLLDAVSCPNLGGLPAIRGVYSQFVVSICYLKTLMVLEKSGGNERSLRVFKKSGGNSEGLWVIMKVCGLL